MSHVCSVRATTCTRGHPARCTSSVSMRISSSYGPRLPSARTRRGRERSGHLHVGIVDLDALIYQTKIRIWYTLGTQDVRKRPTAANARLDQIA